MKRLAQPEPKTAGELRLHFKPLVSAMEAADILGWEDHVVRHKLNRADFLFAFNVSARLIPIWRIWRRELTESASTLAEMTPQQVVREIVTARRPALSSASSAAVLLNITAATCLRLRHSGELASTKTGRRPVITDAALEAFLLARWCHQKPGTGKGNA